MKKLISRKMDFASTVERLCQYNLPAQQAAFWKTLHNDVLSHKVKFPLLEYLAENLYTFFSRETQMVVIHGLSGRVEHGSSVIAGKLLQLQLTTHMDRALTAAIDIIGIFRAGCRMIFARLTIALQLIY